MLRIARDSGGYGVVAAHSGTVLGVLLPAGEPDRAARAAAACAALPGAGPGRVAVLDSLSFPVVRRQRAV